jgi:UDP-N-acetylmuramyl pentapeptide synthase
MLIKNRFDYTGESYELGLQAENKFVTYMKNKGWEVKNSTFKEDTQSHIDFHLTKDGKTIKVDVKSEKKINRSDSNTQTEKLWCEILNVQGNNGWLNGESSHIAFQDGDSYLIVDRERLKERVYSLNTGKQVKNAADALYNLYTRYKRNDLLTIVLKSDIVDLHEEL